MSSSKTGGTPSSLAALSSQLAAAVERAADSVVAIHARRRIPSSGVIWRENIIVSASHTVKRDGDVPVVLPNGEKITASIVGRDAGGTGLVALRFDAKATPVTHADSGSLRVGALALAVGRPGRSPTASFGIVSAIPTDWRTWDGTRLDRVVRLDLNVYDGFSGGAVVDASGALLGLNSSALARGAAMALPTTVVDRVLDELLATGHTRRPFIGVAVQPVVLGTTQSEGGEEISLLITSVAAASPADVAGLLVGDVLRGVSGTPLRHPADLRDLLAEAGAGAVVTLDILRGGKPTTVAITLADRGTSE